MAKGALLESIFARVPLGWSPLSAAPHDAESELLQRIRAGNAYALGEAYDAHHQHVRAFAQRLLGDDNAAEDLVQETFVALPHLLGNFRGESSLRTFLISVAANQSKQHLRAAMRRRAAHARSAPVSSRSPQTPEQHAERRELAARLSAALDALPHEQRIALVLCEIEERTALEAAAIVGVPEGTIRTRVFHGKRKLREALAAQRST